MLLYTPCVQWKARCGSWCAKHLASEVSECSGRKRPCWHVHSWRAGALSLSFLRIRRGDCWRWRQRAGGQDTQCGRCTICHCCKVQLRTGPAETLEQRKGLGYFRPLFRPVHSHSRSLVSNPGGESPGNWQCCWVALQKINPLSCSAGVPLFLQRREQPCHAIAHLAG